MTTRDEHEALAHFRDRYAIPTTELTSQIEERVIGARWGANGYTTREQADELARLFVPTSYPSELACE